MSDQRRGDLEATDGQIAQALDISRRTVIRIKQRFVQGSLEVALTGSFPREREDTSVSGWQGRGSVDPVGV